VVSFNDIHDVVSHITSCRKYSLPPSIEYLDLYQEGMLAALKKVDGYDPSLSSLNTFLFRRVDGAMQDYLRVKDPTPRRGRKVLRKLYARQDEQSKTDGYDLPLSCHASPEDFKSLEYVNMLPLSLDEEPKGAVPGDGLLKEAIPCDGLIPGSDVDYNIKALHEGIRLLPEREKMVIQMYYFDDIILDEIGKLMGVSESRVSQLKTRACERLCKRMKAA
jgi:RNA polymerase sigma factor for flagellar operon FliA